jgi:GxxExxY protein
VRKKEENNFFPPRSPRLRVRKSRLCKKIGEIKKEIDEITGCIVDAAYKIHTGLGPGLLESVYEAVLASELEKRGLTVERQKTISFEYDGNRFDEGLRVDLLVEKLVVIELKSVEKIVPVHGKQVLTYLRLLKLPVGLLINFGAPTMKEGLQRIVNNYQPSVAARIGVKKKEE